MKTVSLPLEPESNLSHQALLEKIQGNIVAPHGREFTRLLLFRFKNPQINSARRACFPAAVSAGLVTSAAIQRRQADKLRTISENDPARAAAECEPFYSFGLTLEGMKQCGYKLESSSDLPARTDVGFLAPMWKDFKNLDDVSSVSDLPNWEGHYFGEKEPHGMWLLANACPEKLKQMEAAVRKFLRRQDARITFVEHGRRWKDSKDPRLTREPFGFLDGLSQPKFFESNESKWTSIPLEQVLIQKDENADHLGQHNGGSFLVLRKLEQNVMAFRAWERSFNGASDIQRLPAPPRSPGALVIGRERNGDPLVTNPPPSGSNDFAFEEDTTRCPFHAHIRKTNPRISGAETNLSALFVRRSAVYDDKAKKGRPQLPPQATEDYSEGATIERGVGLLFMGYMSSIEKQFWVMQKNWFTNPDFPAPDTDRGDPLLRPQAGARSGGPPLNPWPGTWIPDPKGGAFPARDLLKVPFVQTKGGAYFYVPSLEWLRNQKPGESGTEA